MSVPLPPRRSPEELKHLALRQGPPQRSEHGEIEPDAEIIDTRTGQPVKDLPQLRPER